MKARPLLLQVVSEARFLVLVAVRFVDDARSTERRQAVMIARTSCRDVNNVVHPPRQIVHHEKVRVGGERSCCLLLQLPELRLLVRDALLVLLSLVGRDASRGVSVVHAAGFRQECGEDVHAAINRQGRNRPRKRIQKRGGEVQRVPAGNGVAVLLGRCARSTVGASRGGAQNTTAVGAAERQVGRDLGRPRHQSSHGRSRILVLEEQLPIVQERGELRREGRRSLLVAGLALAEELLETAFRGVEGADSFFRSDGKDCFDLAHDVVCR
mmetsp:Transcript_20494/g.51788  ORF Transcript_20494/g.51788 Transcript_20494/m.51788 type:complete len:269 (-) Transcript_20494:1853-2659(-)